MSDDFFSFIELFGVLWLAFWLVGAFALWMGTRSARRDFRGKGYVRPPSGRAWFPFLLERQYNVFDNSSIRFFFGISHFCLMAMILILAAVLVLLGCVALFKTLAGP